MAQYARPNGSLRGESRRVILLHNPDAGREEYGKKRLTVAVREAGHKVICRSTAARNWPAVLQQRADLIVAAGRDGTVGKVARRLIGKKTPLSVLPLGTANSLARHLGFDRPVQKLSRQIGQGRPREFDVGVARGPWGRRYLFEGVGAGLLAEYLRSAGEGEKGGAYQGAGNESARHTFAPTPRQIPGPKMEPEAG